MKSKCTPLLVFAFLFASMLAKGQIIRTIACTGISSYSGDSGSAIRATCGNPNGITVDSFGNVYFSDQYYNSIRKVTPNGMIYTIAGNAGYTYNGASGRADTMVLISPFGLAVGNDNNLYIADNGQAIVRKIDGAGFMTTAAGFFSLSATYYCCDGGPATNARINATGLAFDPGGNMYIADGNGRVRKVNTSDTISTAAGTSAIGYSGSGGPATAAGVALSGVVAVAADHSGNLYLSEQGNNVIRKVNSSGVLSLFAGIPLSSGATGDGGLATNAKLSDVSGVKVDAAGNVYIVDQTNQRIRMVDTSGIIRTIIGTSAGSAGDGGPASSCKISYPPDICIDAHGNIFIAEKGATFGSPGGHRIREVLKVDTMHIIANPGNVVCGGGSASFSVHYTQSPLYGAVYQWRLNGGNVGTNSPFYTDSVVHTGDVIKCYIMDTTGHFPIAYSDSVVMSVIPVVVPTLTVSSSGDTLCAGQQVTLTATSTNGGSSPFYQWQVFGVNVDTGTTYTYFPHNGDIVKCILVSSAVCAIPDTVIVFRTMTVNPSYHPTVSIHVFPHDTISFLGEIITLFTDVTYGGSHPVFKWYKNGVLIPGDDSSSYHAQMYTTNTYRCVLISNAPCVVPPTDTSSLVVISNGTLYADALNPRENDLNIWPNPNNGTFTLRLNQRNDKAGVTKILICNVFGELVYKTDIEAKNSGSEDEITLPGTIAEGIYFLYPGSAENFAPIKFVLKK